MYDDCLSRYYIHNTHIRCDQTITFYYYAADDEQSLFIYDEVG